MKYTQAKLELLKFLKENSTKKLDYSTVSYICGYLSKMTKLNKTHFLNIIKKEGYVIFKDKPYSTLIKTKEDIERHSE